MSDRVPTRFVRTLLRMVGDRGYDFSNMLKDAGVDFVFNIYAEAGSGFANHVSENICLKLD